MRARHLISPEVAGTDVTPLSLTETLTVMQPLISSFMYIQFPTHRRFLPLGAHLLICTAQDFTGNHDHEKCTCNKQMDPSEQESKEFKAFVERWNLIAQRQHS